MVKNMNKKINKVLIFGFLFCAIDQIIKIFLSNVLGLNESIIVIKNFFNITLVHNTGAAFSILSGNSIFLILISIIALIFIFYYIKKDDNINIFTYSLLIGGIIGNLIDRIIYNYVIDYVSIIFGNYYFPIFNFADMCIVISIILIIINMLMEELWKK